MEGWDLERLKARRREIREALDRIRRYTALPDAEFWADERNLYTVMHLLLQPSWGWLGCVRISWQRRPARRRPVMPSVSSAWEKWDWCVMTCLAGWCDGPFPQPPGTPLRGRGPQRVLDYARENLGNFENFRPWSASWPTRPRPDMPVA